jgi:uncharacterized protein GlcG (DUF336 family)
MIRAAALLCVALAATAAQAQPPRPPGAGLTPEQDAARAVERAKLPPRARGPSLALAEEAAHAAIAACQAKTYKVTVVIDDQAGVPILMLSDDGAGEWTQEPAIRKAYTAAKLQMDGVVSARQSHTDPALAARMAADPKMAAIRGGLVMKAGAEVIGALSVSGSFNGGMDEDCARAGIDKVQPRLR